MPLKAKIIPKLCAICGTNDEDKFTPYMYDKCKNCRKITNKKDYLCKYCGEFDKNKFYEGRYNNCKKCYTSHKNMKKKDEKLSEEPVTPENDKPIDVRNVVRKFLHLDYELFEGLTLKEFITEIKAENVELNAKLNKAETEIDTLKNIIKSIKLDINLIDKKIDNNLILTNNSYSEIKNLISFDK
jgi:hypothetical protein